jgi:hypothetical protein
MDMAGWVFLCVLLPIHLVTLATTFAAQFWADHLRTSGIVSKKTPDFVRLFDPLGTHLIEGFYSDRHKSYDSRFITRCVKIARVAMPLDLCAFILFGIAVFTSN